MTYATDEEMAAAASAYQDELSRLVTHPDAPVDPAAFLFWLWDRLGIWLRTNPVLAQNLLEHEVCLGPDATRSQPAFAALLAELAARGAIDTLDAADLEWKAQLRLMLQHREWRVHGYPHDYRDLSQAHIARIVRVTRPDLGDVPPVLPDRRASEAAGAAWEARLVTLLESGVLIDDPLHRLFWLVDQWVLWCGDNLDHARATVADPRFVAAPYRLDDADRTTTALIQAGIDDGLLPDDVNAEDVFVTGFMGLLSHMRTCASADGWPPDARTRAGVLLGRFLGLPAETAAEYHRVAAQTRPA